MPYSRPRIGSRIVRVTPPEKELVLIHQPKLLRQGGVGGWAERFHDRGKASTEWMGTPGHTMTLQLLFDAVRPTYAVDVEAELALLHTFGLPDAVGGEPPVLRLTFGHGQQLRWVVQDLRHVSVEEDPRTGRRVQAVVDVDLLEHREAVLSFSPVEAAEQAAEEVAVDGPPAASGTGRTYTVQPNDTLSRIALRELGDATRFMDIYKLNSPPLTTPDLLPVGLVLKLPIS